MKHAKEAKNIKDTKRLKRKNFIFIIIGVILLGIIACVANNYIIVGKNKMTNLAVSYTHLIASNCKRKTWCE